MATVLVTDGEQRAALAAVRSLGQAGHRVIVCSSRRRSLAGTSRYAFSHVQVPDPLLTPGEFLEAVVQLVRQSAVEVMIPIADQSLLAVLGARDRFRGTTIPFPDFELVSAVSDKAELVKRAAVQGINVPAETRLLSPDDRRTLESESLRFPLVIKPSRSVVSINGKQQKLSVAHAASREQLEAGLDAIPSAGYPVLLQQRIIGPGVGIFLLLWDGETVASFSHRRIREKPPSGGVSVYREGIVADPDLLAQSRGLLSTYGWQGVAMIEFKIDAGGTPYLMEINGRFWGSLQLAVDSGVDFPAMLVALALGKPVGPVARYRVGIRSRWWWGDVDHLLARLTRSPARLALPPGSPGRFAALGAFARVWHPGDRNEILRWNDPAPFIRETLEWFRGR